VLTLYTTPVIYIFFDNLGQRFSGEKPNLSAGDRTTDGDPGAGPGQGPHGEAIA
jgi:multidrug efflux pump